ncbi:protein YjjU [Porphyridium purpureum]|uniref:Protein YjjU n=1 Tax=Porphyridium purpureum TaxID=35688 RepID=A0A5J4Z341_PORPP|nr:protein YjjU [Porphyridium purpureum]|eukprot:POR7507..scf208_2
MWNESLAHPEVPMCMFVHIVHVHALESYGRAARLCYGRVHVAHARARRRASYRVFAQQRQNDAPSHAQAEAKKLPLGAELYRDGSDLERGLKGQAPLREEHAHLHESVRQHPVLRLIRQRAASNSMPGARTDPFKLALAIEGGGMRGCLSAGMAAAIEHLGYHNAFDAVYGASAGSIIGAYFVSQQVPRFGCGIYYDVLCNGREFIDLTRLLLGKVLGEKNVKPVLHLDLLLDEVMQKVKPLNWDTFWEKHQHQPLKPVATCANTGQSRVLDEFQSLSELLDALRASARVPGIAGPPVKIRGDTYVDALLSEPLPFRSAIQDGCTHVLVLRTRPEKCTVAVQAGLYEKFVASPAFRSGAFHHMAEFIKRGGQLPLYAQELAFLDKKRDEKDGSGPPYITFLAPPKGSEEVNQLEVRRSRVLAATKLGFAVAYETLSELAQVGMGARAADIVFAGEENKVMMRRAVRDVPRRKRKASKAPASNIESNRSSATPSQAGEMASLDQDAS